MTVRYELSPPNGKEWMKVTCSKHNEIQKLYIYKAAIAKGWWGIWGLWGKFAAENKKHTIGIALKKGLGKNGMNVAREMEMSILLKPCGAEVCACNDSENGV